MFLRRVADTLLAALLAPPCAVCGRVIERPLDGAVCDVCWAAVSPHALPFFLPHIAHAQAIGPYEATLRDVLQALKYDRRRSIAPRLSRMMAAHGQHLLSDADVVVPVPLHSRRLRQRGFNQAEDLARGLGTPVANLLRRVRATTPQVDLPAERRRDNVRDAFAVRPRLGLSGRTITTPALVVLIDDVATTGATLEACARALKGAGVAEVRALTAARAAPGRHQTRRG
jgi:ComF family protein